MNSWKEELAGRLEPALAREIDVYEVQMELRRQGKLDERIFAESRLRRGVYGQRYDNGQRHDGTSVQQLAFPCGELTKGPETIWDAPGMLRIKVPFGGVTATQMEELADLSEEYSTGILHITTRQDFQLHYVHIEDTPDLMRRLAAVGITTREACGNTIRNVTACPVAGVCHGETFDVTPYASACFRFLLGHPDAQDFGRKFKIAFSGCKHEGCGLAHMHDLGAVATVVNENGEARRGFEIYVGGGLGAVPHRAELLETFVPVEELLPTTQAIARVFARHGEKKIRSKARLKFLVAKLGIEEFRRQVQQERRSLEPDPAWQDYFQIPGSPETHQSTPKQALHDLNPASPFARWVDTNVYMQRQTGFATVTVALPLGDLSASQMRRLAQLSRRFAHDNVRTTVEQNLVLRWVSETDLEALHEELEQIALNEPVGGCINDITSCPGTDTCKLGISSSRGLARELRRQLSSKQGQPEAVRKLRIKISGCFNSCGQHHVADIGFYGVSRTVGGRKVPHFQVLLGGRWKENAGSYGLAIGSVPSKRVPETLDRITSLFAKQRLDSETFQDFVGRIGKVPLRNLLDDLMLVPSYQQEPFLYSDWGDPREFTLGDMGIGECAGEVTSVGEFELASAERMVFEAQLELDKLEFERADQLAYQAMLEAALGLVKGEEMTVSNRPEVVVEEFRKRFYDTGLFHDRFAGGKFGQYLLGRHQAKTPPTLSAESCRRQIEQAQLFIEAAHGCRDRLLQRENRNLNGGSK